MSAHGPITRRPMTRRAALRWMWSAARASFRAAFWAAVGAPALLFATHRNAHGRTVVFAPHERTGCAFKDGVYLLSATEPKETEPKNAGPNGTEPVALSGRCTHLGCTVAYDTASDTFRCPCHRSVYDGQGRRLQGPAQADLARLAATLHKDGTVTVTIENT